MRFKRRMGLPKRSCKGGFAGETYKHFLEKSTMAKFSPILIEYHKYFDWRRPKGDTSRVETDN